MKHAFALVLVLGSFFAACGGGNKPANTNASTAAKPAAAIELGEITLYDEADPAMKIHADGTTEMVSRSGKLDLSSGHASSRDLPITWKPGPTIKSDGTIAFEGKDVARIEETAIVALSTGNRMAISDTTLAIAEGITIGIAADNKLVVSVGGMSKEVGHVEGADTPGKRRIVIAMLSMFAGRKGEARVETREETGSGAEPVIQP